MADDLSLLLKIKGDAAGGKTAVAETRAAMATLRTSVGSEMNALRVTTTNAAQGTKQLTNGFQALSSAVVVIDGPLGGVASRLRAMGTVASEAGQILGAAGTQAVGTGASIAAMAGPIGLAIAAAAALVGGFALVTKGLFDLAVSAADFRGKMFDLAQQTGVAVEMLSTLEVIAKTTGGSIDSIAQSLVIFQGKLDEAQDSSSKAGKQFAELGISTHDTETAFRDALKVLFEMPVGFHQTNEAAELFGRRGGKQVLAMLKEMNGDLPGTTARLRELGLVISREDAEAADKFNDQLAILGFQFRVLLGKEVIPAALKALQELSKVLKDNKRALDLAGAAVGNFAKGIGVVFSHNLSTVNTALAISAILYERIAIAAQTLSGGLPAVPLPVDLTGAQGGAGGQRVISVADIAREAFALSERAQEAVKAAKKEAQEAAVAALKMAALRLQATLEGLSEEDRVAKQSLDRRKSDFELYAIDTKFIEDRRHFLVMAGLLSETEAAEKLSNAHQREIALKEIENKKLEEGNRHKKAGDELDDQRAKIEKEIADTIAKLNASTKEYVVTVDQYQQAVDDLVESLAKQGVTLDPVIEKTLRFNAAMAGSRDRVREAIAALDDLSNAPPPPTLAGDVDPGSIGKIIEGQIGPPPQILAHIDALRLLGQVATETFASMAQGIGGMIQQWVLYGSAGPGALKKMVAAVLAAAAAQSAVEAIMQLAYAWKESALASASLAVFDVRGAALHSAAAAAHLTSAAVFGGVAAVAAATGRLLAGNSFSDQGSQGGRGGTNSGASGSSSTPRSYEVDRRASTSTVNHVVELRLVGELGEMVEAKFIDRYGGGGRLRNFILSDGQG